VLTPCFLDGNATQAIPNKYRRTGVKVSLWFVQTLLAGETATFMRFKWKLWQFGRGKSRLGGMTVKKTWGRNLLGRKLPTKHLTSMRRRFVCVRGESTWLEMKVWMWSTLVCTFTSLVHTGMYWSLQNFLETLKQTFLWVWPVGCHTGSVRLVLWYPSLRIPAHSQEIVHVVQEV
jgi:hypothetical protein